VGDWEQALRYAKEGNERYCKKQGILRDTYEQDRDALKDGQKPFAIVVTCADSRVAPEIYLDLRLGDIFVIRNAGNVVDSTALGSIEYAVEHLKTPLILVIGHSKCGAVTGALHGGEFPENLSLVIGAISEAISGSSDLCEAIAANTKHSADIIKSNKVVSAFSAKVIGAHYDIESGIVSYLT
jgi:carbonic anhydrase